MNVKRTMMCVGVTLLLAAPLAAQLDDNTYPGSMCVVVNSTSNSQKPVLDSDGQLFNGSPAHTMEVVCPVVGPFHDLSDGISNVFVTDHHTTENVCCEARANNAGFVQTSPQVCSQSIDPPNIPIQNLELVPPVLNFSFTSRYFYCRIPPVDQGQMSGIRLYRY